MILGLAECDEDIAYILKYGKSKPYERHRCEFIPCEDEKSIESYRDFQQANFDEYFDWAKTYRYALFR